MIDLETRLREDLPRLADLLTDSTLAPRVQPVETRATVVSRRPARRRALVVAGAALIVAVVAAIALSQQSSPHVSAPTDQAPDDLGANTGPIPAGQYVYTRTTGFLSATAVVSPSLTYTVAVLTTQESWTGADGSGRTRATHGEARALTPENDRVIRDAGLDPATLGTGDRDDVWQAGELHYVDLSRLPADDAAIRAWLDQAAYVNPPAHADAAQLVETISDWRFSSWLRAPIEVRQALVSVLSSTRGMTTEPKDGMTVVSVIRG